jgi:hypothetical protein
MAGPLPRPFRTAFICAAIAFIIPVVTILIAWGAPGSGYEGGGRWIGFILGLTVLPAVITGLLARRAKTAWSPMKVAAVYVIVLFAIALLYIIGKLPPRPR